MDYFKKQLGRANRFLWMLFYGYWAGYETSYASNKDGKVVGYFASRGEHEEAMIFWMEKKLYKEMCEAYEERKSKELSK